jgi:mono/diheme cytochrome c family protein
MPNFFLGDRQVEGLVTWLLSRKPGWVKEPLQVAYDDTPAGRIADGRNLVRDLNCVACHRIDGNAAVLDQYHWLIEGPELIFDEVNAPPALRGEGAKVRPDWLYGFLKSVITLRPWLEVRMPQFDLSHEQATRLAAYFASLSQDESRWLEQRLASFRRRPEVARGRARTDLRRYAVRNRLVPAPSVDPAEADPEEIAAADRQILEDAEFLKSLLDVPYPFAEPPPAAVPPDRLADGEAIFFELECLACHVFGDPTLPGANARPTAQNLDLTYHRLQPRWVQAWMEAPGRIQPGTKMPSLFGNGTASAFAEFPPQQRDRVRAQLNAPTLLDDGEAQTRIMTDFLYSTGANRLNKIQPGGLEQAPVSPGSSVE